MRFLNNIWMVILLLGMSQQVAAQGTGKIIDEIVAKVDNHIILQSDVEMAYQNALANGQEMPGGKCEAFKSILTQKILYARAEIDSILVDDKIVDGELKRRMDYFINIYGGKDKLEEQMGKSVTQLKDELRPLVEEQMTIQMVQQQVTSDLEVTPLEVRRYFKKIPKDSLPYLPAEVEVAQIVKKPEVSKSQKEEVRKTLMDIKKAVEGGDDFCTYTSISQDPGSAANCGDLGWHGRGELVPEFEATAMSLEPGQIADPVESDFGFHLIKLDRRLGNRFKARHILLRPESTRADFAATTRFLDSLRTAILADSISFEKAAMAHSDDKETRPYGGSATSTATGETLVPKDQLPPSLFFAVEKMEVGTISKPEKFRMKGGEDAVRIIYYKQYVPPHYASLERDYQKLALAATNDKKSRAINDWVTDAIRMVYLEIDDRYQDCAQEVIEQQPR